MIDQVIKATKVDWNAKNGPLSHQKMKLLVLDYVQLLMIGQAIWAMKVDWTVKKGPQSHQKIKYSFLDYVQLLMIGQMIWAMKVDQNVTKGPLSHGKMKCWFLDYVHLLMFSWGIRCPSPQQKKFDFFKSTFLTWPKYTIPLNILAEYEWFCTKHLEQVILPSQMKWVQGVVRYSQNLQKHKYLSGILTVLHQTFRTGLVFLSWSKWVQGVVCYDRNL